MDAKTDIVGKLVTDLNDVVRGGVSASQIAKDSGVKESWLRMLMRGEIPNPGARQFHAVRTYLDRKRRRATDQHGATA